MVRGFHSNKPLHAWNIVYMVMDGHYYKSMHVCIGGMYALVACIMLCGKGWPFNKSLVLCYVGRDMW